MFLNIDYAQRAAARDKTLMDDQSHSTIISFDDDDEIDYEQLFDDQDVKFDNAISEKKKPIKHVRFAPIVSNDTLTPTLLRSSSQRPTFDIEFDFDSLASPSNESTTNNCDLEQKPINNTHWKDAFLSDLHVAKKHKPSTNISPATKPMHIKTNDDTLWDFMKELNPELFEKLQGTLSNRPNNHDRFSQQKQQQILTEEITNKKTVQPILIPNKEVPSYQSVSINERISTTESSQTKVSIIEIRLDKDQFNQIHEELLHFLLPYHKILCQENIWPQEHSFTIPNTSFQLIKDIIQNKKHVDKHLNRSDILKHLMFIYTITSFLYVFAYCSLQTAIRHVENVIVQNMKHVFIDQQCGKPLFDLLTKTHNKFEDVLHPKILRIKQVFVEFFNKRRQSVGVIKQLSEPRFLLLVQYEPVELLYDIERGLSSIIELRSYLYDKQTNIERDEFNDLWMYHNMIIIRTRQISTTVISQPKQLTLIIEYEYGEQYPAWYRYCQQQDVAYLAYKTILPIFTVPKNETIKSVEKNSSPTLKNDLLNLPTIVLARPLVDNFKLLRTLECRHDISIVTRDYHLLAIPIDQQPDILIDWMTSMLIFDLNTKLDINFVRHKIQSMTLHSCRIYIAILTSGSTPDFILSTYITPITQLAKQIQESQINIDIQVIKSFSSLDEFANYVAQLVRQSSTLNYLLTPIPSWNEKMLLRRCSSLNSVSAQLILQRLKNVDLSTINLNILIDQCPEIPIVFLKAFLSDLRQNA